MPTRQWLNRCHSKRVPFHWTINPYRGCEYGCKYCYARYTHEFLEKRDSGAFEQEIYAKDWDRAAFARELKRVRAGQSIGIGTATDPYQPAERKYGRTRQVLEALCEVSGRAIFVTTKSDLVSRDADLFAYISRRNQVRVAVTITTLDARLARLTEPYAPRPDLRMEAVAELAAAGTAAGVLASPILPMLTDSRQSLQALANMASKIGATHFSAGVLFLQPTARLVFFDFLREHFPEILERYQQRYKSGAYLRGAYTETMSRRVNAVRIAAGLERRDSAFAVPLMTEEPAQLTLF